MKQITLNKNSWHFKYYSELVSDTPPRSLCPYFWTMVLLIIISPVIGLAYSFIYIRKNVMLFLRSTTPKPAQKPIKTMSYEELEVRLEKMKKREKVWNKAGDYFSLIFKFILLPAGGLLIIFAIYKTISVGGLLPMIVAFGILGTIFAFIAGMVHIIEYIAKNHSNKISRFFYHIMPWNWKIVAICGEMIRATYTKMCPLITWEGETKKVNL